MTTSSLSKPPASHSAGYARPLALLTLVALIAQLLVSGPSQVIDPFVKHDDYPALLLMPELYYWKTLAEGRWINYLWLLRWAESPAAERGRGGGQARGADCGRRLCGLGARRWRGRDAGAHRCLAGDVLEHSRRALGRSDLPVGGGHHMSAAHVSGHGGGERQ